MISLTSFKGEFCQGECTIYSVNNTIPNKYTGGSMTSRQLCPHCGERNIFRVYEPEREFNTKRYSISVYDCKCPKCNKDFEILDVYDQFED